MSESERLRALLATLTEGCASGPWHSVESGDRAAHSWWLENPAGDSSFPEPDDVALMLNALPALLDVAEAARALLTTNDFWLAGHADCTADDCRVIFLREALNRLDGAS